MRLRHLLCLLVKMTGIDVLLIIELAMRLLLQGFPPLSSCRFLGLSCSLSQRLARVDELSFFLSSLFSSSVFRSFSSSRSSLSFSPSSQTPHAVSSPFFFLSEACRLLSLLFLALQQSLLHPPCAALFLPSSRRPHVLRKKERRRAQGKRGEA